MIRAALFCFLLITAVSCTKEISGLIDNQSSDAKPSEEYIQYTISKGQHYSDKNGYSAVQTNEMKMVVKFDSTAIYTTLDPNNQLDINKLYGFADNNRTHHEFSARLGWRWNDGALRLFGYVYNNGMVSSKELRSVTIGAAIPCGIKVTPTAYIFTVQNHIDSLPRTSTTPTASGYKLYPYFGGDETAPHQVNIYIKEVR